MYIIYFSESLIESKILILPHRPITPKIAPNGPVLSILGVFWQVFFPYGTYFIKNTFQTVFKRNWRSIVTWLNRYESIK